MFATLHLDKGSPNGFAVPATCLVNRGQLSVYVVCDGKARLTPVRISKLTGGKAEILSGLRATDRIVVDPSKLKGEVVPVEIEKMP